MKRSGTHTQTLTFQPLAVAAAAIVSKIEKKVTASPNAGYERSDFRQPHVQARSERVCPVRRRDAGRNPAQGVKESSLALPASEAKQSQQSPERGRARQEDEGEGVDGRERSPPSQPPQNKRRPKGQADDKGSGPCGGDHAAAPS